MFAQLDTGSSYRRPITRELWPAGGPHRPITTKDLAAFESITPVEAKPVEEWETRKNNKARSRDIPIPEGLDLTRKAMDICLKCGVTERQVTQWRKIAGISWKPSTVKINTGRPNKSGVLIDWSGTTIEEHETTYPEVMAARLNVKTSAVNSFRFRNKIQCLLPRRNGRRTVTPPHSPDQPGAPQASAAPPAPSPDVPATPQ